jgi:hypothetical protein
MIGVDRILSFFEVEQQTAVAPLLPKPAPPTRRNALTEKNKILRKIYYYYVKLKRAKFRSRTGFYLSDRNLLLGARA